MAVVEAVLLCWVVVTAGTRFPGGRTSRWGVVGKFLWG